MRGPVAVDRVACHQIDVEPLIGTLRRDVERCPCRKLHPCHPVPLDYSIWGVTCTVVGMTDAVMAGLPGAAQDRLPADVPDTRPGHPGVPRWPGERCRVARAPA